jgi:hypothetical protein
VRGSSCWWSAPLCAGPGDARGRDDGGAVGDGELVVSGGKGPALLGEGEKLAGPLPRELLRFTILLLADG